MSTFKVGDKVTPKKVTPSHCCTLNMGEVYEVVEVFTDSIPYHIKVYNPRSDHNERYEGLKFNLVKESPTPHKHRDVIIAWANGEKIQRKIDKVWHDWDKGFDYTPTFGCSGADFRVKPENTNEIQAIREEMDKLSARLKELEG